MRAFAIIGCCVLLACPMARAETPPERTDAPSRVPTAAELISQLYQFDLFQQNAIDRTDSGAAGDVLTTAAGRAEAASKRDKALAELQRQTGTDVPAQRKAAAMRADSLAAVDRTDGPAYVRQFYAAQLAEYELTVALLESYLQSPDNEDIGRFAAAQLPVLRSELTDIRSALADK
jgi:uncharacterized protein DUF4142